jgi:hypothetical protein
VEVEQRSRIKFCIELSMTPVHTKDLFKKLNECARTVSRNIVYPSHTQITDKMFYESERKVMDGCQF